MNWSTLYHLHNEDAEELFEASQICIEDRPGTMGYAPLHPSYIFSQAALTVGWVERSVTHRISLECGLVLNGPFLCELFFQGCNELQASYSYRFSKLRAAMPDGISISSYCLGFNSGNKLKRQKASNAKG
jgi:hypothetical protein